MSTQPPQSDVTPNVAPPQNLDDAALASWLEQCRRAGHTVGYLHAESLCKVFNATTLTEPLYPADPDRKSKAIFKKLAKNNLLRDLNLPNATLSAAITVDPSWILAPTTSKSITDLVNYRLNVLGRSGRGGDISQSTAWKVWTEAGGRCMFEGCGEDMSAIPLYTGSARIGYLAHIIASNPHGPRGTQADSHRLADDPDNIMLMCDAHHRLIDCFAPSEYQAARLYAMRQAHRDLVRNYMKSLAYPRVKAITLLADLAGVQTNFQESDLIAAVLDIGRAMIPGVEQYIRRTERDDRRTSEFWVQYLHEHLLDIQHMVSRFRIPDAAGVGELAVFPLHHVATLVLAGRIIGEARPVRVFQYHRHKRTWRWDKTTTPQPAGTFMADGLISRPANEVLISVELTANLDSNAVPLSIANEIERGSMPWIRIRIPDPNPACIQHPADLDQFMNIARQVINHIHDVVRPQRVHLIAISPASTAFCFGQMLQAGHHPTYTIYDRPDRDSPFVDAFSIDGHRVTAEAGHRTTTIELR